MLLRKPHLAVLDHDARRLRLRRGALDMVERNATSLVPIRCSPVSLPGVKKTGAGWSESSKVSVRALSDQAYPGSSRTSPSRRTHSYSPGYISRHCSWVACLLFEAFRWASDIAGSWWICDRALGCRSRERRVAAMHVTAARRTTMTMQERGGVAFAAAAMLAHELCKGVANRFRCLPRWGPASSLPTSS